MNIAIIVPENLPLPAVKGGAVESLVDSISKLFIQRCDHVNIYQCSIFDEKVNEFNSKLQSNRIQNIYVKICYILIKIFANRYLWGSKFYAFPYLKSIIVQLKSSNLDFDIIYVHNRPQFIPLIKKNFPKSKIFLHLHNEYLHVGSSRPQKLFFIETILNDVDKVICVSKYISQGIITSAPKFSNKIISILNGIELNRFKNLNAKKNDLRIKYNLNNNSFVCLFSGRLVEEKGPHILLESAINLLDEGFDIKFIFIGGGFFSDSTNTTYINRLLDRAKDYSNIEFIGFIPYNIVHEYYAVSDLFVFPSIWEDPSPLVIYEAIAMNLPIISTKSGGVPEIVSNYENIIWVEKNSPECLKSAIMQIRSSPIGQIEYETSHLGIERMTNEIIELWQI